MYPINRIRIQRDMIIRPLLLYISVKFLILFSQAWCSNAVKKKVSLAFRGVAKFGAIWLAADRR
jgi:hypothetical protein